MMLQESRLEMRVRFQRRLKSVLLKIIISFISILKIETYSLSFWLCKMSNPEKSPNTITIPIVPVSVSIASPTLQRRRVSPNYTPDELMSVLHIMEDILPIGPNKWQLVVDNHVKNYTRRDVPRYFIA